MIICFGEILWDCLPRGLFPGGAPINVAYHLRQLGASVLPLTAVGNDFLGGELLRRLEFWGLPLHAVRHVPNKLTGVVLVDFTHSQNPRYDIVEDAAWDQITVPDTLLQRGSEIEAIVFGSLSQRSEQNRSALSQLTDAAPKARRIFDVNLRPPFDSPERIWPLASRCDLIKLNSDELQQLLHLPELKLDRIRAAAAQFASKTGAARICVTCGGQGAGLLWENNWHWEPARKIEVRDAVGAGDAFLAAIISGWLLRRLPPAVMLKNACRLAEYVATQDGATPAYPAGNSNEW